MTDKCNDTSNLWDDLQANLMKPTLPELFIVFKFVLNVMQYRKNKLN